MSALENFFVKNEINLQHARFARMDTANVNCGEKNGLKRHLEHKVLLIKWIGCNNHKLALTFKHLIPSSQCIALTDIFLLNCWKYFKYRSLPINILENTSDMYGESPNIAHVPPLLDDKHTSMYVKRSNSIFKIFLVHFQHHMQNERKMKHYGCSFKARLFKPLPQI